MLSSPLPTARLGAKAEEPAPPSTHGGADAAASGSSNGSDQEAEWWVAGAPHANGLAAGSNCHPCSVEANAAGVLAEPSCPILPASCIACRVHRTAPPSKRQPMQQPQMGRPVKKRRVLREASCSEPPAPRQASAAAEQEEAPQGQQQEEDAAWERECHTSWRMHMLRCL